MQERGTDDICNPRFLQGLSGDVQEERAVSKAHRLPGSSGGAATLPDIVGCLLSYAGSDNGGNNPYDGQGNISSLWQGDF